MQLDPVNPEISTRRRHLVSATPLRRDVDIFKGRETSLADDVETAMAAVPGDQPRDNLFALALLAHATAAIPGHIVDIGAGQGRAAAVLGHAAKATGRSRVFAVDLFPESEDAPDDVACSLDSLLASMTVHGLLEWVLPHHGTGATFAQLMPEDFRCRVLLLEGAHACSDVATDIFALERFLAPGGWLAVDHAFSSFPGATLALETLFRQRSHFDMARHLTPTLYITRKQS
jgi:SAM-dependent methyltransferase